jgi:hypothetical protein
MMRQDGSSMIEKAKAWRRCGMGVVACVLAGVPGVSVAGVGQPGAVTVAAGASNDQAQADALLARLLAMIAANPGASMAQMEGQLMLAINQAQVTCTVSQIALSRLQQAVLRNAPPVRAAVARANTLARGCTGGSIAGIGPANGDLGLLQQGTTLGLASGGSNYLTAP